VNHRYVFVGGLHGSGTSLVHRWLRAHPAISGFSGTGAPQDEGQHLQRLLPTARSLGGRGRFGFSPQAHLTEASDLAVPSSAAGLLADWETHWAEECVIRVEKSPPNMLRFRLLQSLFPGALCVLVLRHPLAVAASTRSKGRLSRFRSRRALVEHWLHCHETFAGDRESLQRVVVLRYEELVAAPETGLDSVFSALGQPGIPAPEVVDLTRDRAAAAQWEARLGRAPRPVRLLKLEARALDWGYSLEGFGTT
jgi:hypothetical protein